MKDFIVVPDRYAVKREYVYRVNWIGKEKLQVVFMPIIDGVKQIQEFEGHDALSFWEQYSGQRASWDRRRKKE